MKRGKLRRLLFWALCCDCGLFAKQLISPAANLLTDALRIPGGVGTAFSLMFLVIASELMPQFGCCVLMGCVQSMLMLAIGRVGSMGVLSPLGYILPGFGIDVVMLLLRKGRFSRAERMMLANLVGSVCACLAANAIVFHLRGAAFWLYAGVAATVGALCGLLGSRAANLAGRALSIRAEEESE